MITIICFEQTGNYCLNFRETEYVQCYDLPQSSPGPQKHWALSFSQHFSLRSLAISVSGCFLRDCNRCNNMYLDTLLWQQCVTFSYHTNAFESYIYGKSIKLFSLKVRSSISCNIGCQLLSSRPLHAAVARPHWWVLTVMYNPTKTTYTI